MNEIKCLILSSTIDFSTDLVCCELERRGYSYLRVNRDRFDQYCISVDLQQHIMTIVLEGKVHVVRNDSSLTIFYRAPVFYRYSKELSLDDQLKRGQWGSFIRNLIIFDKARWLNNPVSTYRAENKMYQLHIAEEIGLTVPKTYIGNSLPSAIEDNDSYIVKALDTPVFYDGDQEMFTYSISMTGNTLKKSALHDAPVIIQEKLYPKIDLRITVVGEKIFPAQIQFCGNGIDGDWRKMSKDGLTYTAVALPNDLENKIHLLMDKLNLAFGGLDFAVCNNEYYFIEINPTGEWGWLVKTAGFKIQKAIADYLEAE